MIIKAVFCRLLSFFLFIFANEINSIYDMNQVCKLILYLFCVAIVQTGCRDKVQSKAETADSFKGGKTRCVNTMFGGRD